MFFVELPEKFQNSCVKEQLYVHTVGTPKETDGLLKDLIKSALSSVLHNVRKFKTFLFLLRCSIWSSDTKNIQNCIIVIFHLCLTKPSLEPTGYNVGSHLLFHNWCKTIAVFIPFPRKVQRCMCMCVREKDFLYAENKLHHRWWVPFPAIPNSNFVKWKLSYVLLLT